MSIDVDRYRSTYGDFKFEEIEPSVLEVIFSNPGKHNAVSAKGHAQLADMWRDFDRDEAVRVVLVRGEGPVFSAGGEMDVIDEMIESHAARLRGLKETRDIIVNMIECSKPIVSAMHGVAVGAGLCVGLLADVPIVTPGVKLIDGHTKFGVAAGDHATLIWPLTMGLAKAKYHAMTCEPILGSDALAMGMVALCVEDDQLLDTARTVSSRLATGAQSAIRLTKHSMNNWLRAALPAYDASLAFEILGLAGDDVREGLAGLREKRPPNFA